MSTKLLTYLPVLPEIITLTMALVILLIGCFNRKALSAVYVVSQLTLLLLILVTSYAAKYAVGPEYFFHQSFVWDRLAVILKLFTYVSVFSVFCFHANTMTNMKFYK